MTFRLAGLVLETIREAVDQQPHVQVPVGPEEVVDDDLRDLQARLRPQGLAAMATAAFLFCPTRS